MLSDQELMASVQHIYIPDRDILLHRQSWGQMNETVINSGLWNMCREDLGRLGKLSGKKQQLIYDAAFLTGRCGLGECVDGCWGFLTALLRLPELSEGLIPFCEALAMHCPHWIFKESARRIRAKYGTW